MRSAEVLVIGGGASGMMSAIIAARQGVKVLLIEKMNQLGKKILATGNGKCNYTNYLQESYCYRSDDDVMVWNLLQEFGVSQTLDFFKEIGIIPVDREGYVYPATGQATSIRNALERELRRCKVEIHTEEAVREIRRHENLKQNSVNGYQVSTSKGKYLAKKVIVAVGGCAAMVHGSTGDGYPWLKRFGHKIETPVPALTSCILGEKYTKEWSGVRQQGEVSVYSQDSVCMGKDKGELQLVATGISGIPVFQISRFAARELKEGRKPYLLVDFMPEWTEQELLKEILKRKEKWFEESLGNILDGLLHQKLASALVKKINLSLSICAGKISEEECQRLVHTLKHWKMSVTAVGDFEKAQVTCGGIPLKEVTNQMESKYCQGLYITGELLNLDGICGGYNLQWAWTSGYIAGLSAARSCKESLLS